MFTNQRKTIGVFLNRAASQFQNLLCQGIIAEAEKRGYNVAIFSAFGNYGQNERYYVGEKQLYELPPYEDLDGAILALDTMEEHETRELVLKNVRNRCRCPIISVREVVEGVNNLLVDNNTCMEGVIRHFVEKHGMKRLCFMTGPEDRWEAKQRLGCFLRLMEEYGLPVGERQVFYGDFWENKGREACDWFLEGQPMPDAILCANDHMAIAVASELINRGLRIPEDICVSGYDGIDDALKFSPSITSMRVDFKGMGTQAVQLIDGKQDCPEDVRDYFCEAELVLRESCGCQKKNGQDVIWRRRSEYEEAKVAHNRRMQFSFMSIWLGGCHTIPQISDQLEHYVGNIVGFKKYCACFCENLKDREDYSDYSDTMEMRIGLLNEGSIGHINIPFDRRELLPEVMTDESPQIWYFTPLHFQDRTFGYEALSFWTLEETGNLFLDWNIIISNKIQDCLLHYEMERLVQELENMYDRDALTGFYNRRGMETYGEPLFERGRDKSTPLFTAIIDLDGMKQINDNYGHAEGDFALKTVCSCIQASCRGESIHVRTGGDEFAVIAEGEDKETVEAWLRDFEDRLDDFNRRAQKEYAIHASYGYICRVPEAGDTMETFLKDSDAVMYSNKIENKKKRNEPLR